MLPGLMATRCRWIGAARAVSLALASRHAERDTWGAVVVRWRLRWAGSHRLSGRMWVGVLGQRCVSWGRTRLPGNTRGRGRGMRGQRSPRLTIGIRGKERERRGDHRRDDEPLCVTVPLPSRSSSPATAAAADDADGGAATKGCFESRVFNHPHAAFARSLSTPTKCPLTARTIALATCSCISEVARSTEGDGRAADRDEGGSGRAIAA